jgi:hypothetical protein
MMSKTARKTSKWSGKKLKSDTERLEEELRIEGARRSNFIEIISYSRPEFFLMFIGLVAAAVRGCVMPAFSFFFAQLFSVRVCLSRIEYAGLIDHMHSH